MESFKSFFIDEYIALESIMYLDRTLFKNICEGKYEPTPEALAKYELENALLFEADETGDEKKYLQNDEEIELIKKYQADPNSKEGMDALDKLVENKMPYIYSKVNKHLISHPNQSAHKEDLVQEASLALIKAIEEFDVNSGNIFNAYAAKCVTGAILNAYNPVRQKSIVDGKVDDNGNVTTTTSIDAPVSGSRGEWADKDTTVGDSIPDPNEKMPWEGGESEQEEKALFNDFLKRLPEAEAKAIKMYFPASDDDKKTLEEIGQELGMTKMGVKKLIDRAVNKLKAFAREMGFKNGSTPLK